MRRQPNNAAQFGRNSDDEPDDPRLGAAELDGCLSRCLALDGCHGVVVSAHQPIVCYARATVILAECDRDSYWDMWLLPAPPSPPAPPGPPPAPPASPAPPSPPPPPPGYGTLDHGSCQAYLSDPSHRFHQLWGMEGWVTRNRYQPACWGGGGTRFFDDAWWGRSCQRNWYTGNRGPLGHAEFGPTHSASQPHFTGPAPALLGFDEAIDSFCTGGGNHAESCVRSNLNILSLYGRAIPYNLCRNFE